MARKASDGIQDLIDRTGGARVKSTVVVDQVYAQDQHETLYYKHPHGGGPKYLEAPLFAEHPKWIQQFANKLLRRGIDAAREWGGVGRALKNKVPTTAPVHIGNLRQSASLTVREGSSIIVHEPAAQPRLSRAQLDAEDELT